MKHSTVILGGGHAGVQVAASLRDEGFDGSITLVNDEDVLPYHKPPLSKSFLKSVDSGLDTLRSQAFYSANRIQLLHSRALELDLVGKKVGLSEGGWLDFTNLVLATGARPRTPVFLDCRLNGVCKLRSASDAQDLRTQANTVHSIAIIGGGYIGLEVAHSLIAAGKQVAIVEQQPGLLRRGISLDAGAFLQSQATKAGIAVHTLAHVEAIETNSDRMTGIRLRDGTRIVADLFVLGIGVVPNSELAERAGLAVDNGIIVDSSLRSSAPDLFAVGDVARFPFEGRGEWIRLESVQNATDQARAVARAIVGLASPYVDLPRFWSDQGGNKLQIAGLVRDGGESTLLGSIEEGSFSIFSFHDRRLTSVESINRPTDHILARRLLSSRIPVSKDDVMRGTAWLKKLLD